MSQPKILHAVDELNDNGFYDKSTYLGDVRTKSTCLDNVVENGIYSFTGGNTSPKDKAGNYKWILIVYSCEDCTSVEQVARKLDPNNILEFNRYLQSGKWTEFVDSRAYTDTKYTKSIEYTDQKFKELIDTKGEIWEITMMDGSVVYKSIATNCLSREKWSFTLIDGTVVTKEMGIV